MSGYAPPPGISKPTRKYQEPDWFLQYLIDMVNGSPDGFEFNMSITVNGMIVTGTLISGRKYFDMFAKAYSDATPGSADYKEKIRERLASQGNTYNTENYDQSSNREPSYIHLENAKFLTGPNSPISSPDGILWRGRIIEVSGFILGELSFPI